VPGRIKTHVAFLGKQAKHARGHSSCLPKELLVLLSLMMGRAVLTCVASVIHAPGVLATLFATSHAPMGPP
jgi:hypothetical protein